MVGAELAVLVEAYILTPSLEPYPVGCELGAKISGVGVEGSVQLDPVDDFQTGAEEAGQAHDAVRKAGRFHFLDALGFVGRMVKKELMTWRGRLSSCLAEMIVAEEQLCERSPASLDCDAILPGFRCIQGVLRTRKHKDCSDRGVLIAGDSAYSPNG